MSRPRARGPEPFARVTDRVTLGGLVSIVALGGCQAAPPAGRPGPAGSPAAAAGGSGAMVPASRPRSPLVVVPSAPVLAAGAHHTCALGPDRRVRCWGENTFGQLGDGTTADRFAPVEVKGLDGVEAVHAAGLATCARRADGVWCWGTLGGEAGRKGEPQPMRGFETARAVVMGAGFLCGLEADGGVRCRGEGIGAPEDAPQRVGGMERVVELVAGWRHVCGRTDRGEVRCWGNNDEGQLGAGHSDASSQAVSVAGLGGVTRLWADGSLTLARDAAGEVHVWGTDATGRRALRPEVTADSEVITARSVQGRCVLGDGGAVRCRPRDEPASPRRPVTFPTPVTDLVVGSGHACGLGTDGVLRCFGDNDHGTLGLGDAARAVGRPTRVQGADGAAEIAVGEWSVCARLASGRVACWGAHPAGGGSATAATVAGITGATALHAGGQYTCAVAAGVTRCWGLATWRPCIWDSPDNCQAERWAEPRLVPGLAGVRGALELVGDCVRRPRAPVVCARRYEGGAETVVAGTEDAVQLAGGAWLRCLRRRGGGVACRWPSERDVVDLVGIDDAIDLDASSSHFCAVRRGGTVVCSALRPSGEACRAPDDPCGEVRPVAGIEDALDVAVGVQFSCVRHRDRGVSCWGRGAHGVLGDGTTGDRDRPVRLPLRDVVELAAREHHVCARRQTGEVWCWGDVMTGRASLDAAEHGVEVAVATPTR